MEEEKPDWYLLSLERYRYSARFCIKLTAAAGVLTVHRSTPIETPTLAVGADARMPRLIVLISSLAAFLLAVGSALADDPINPLDACTAGGNVDANPKCVEDIYRATDRQLTEAVKTIVAKIEPGENLPPEKVREWRDDLIAAERAWETFRDKDCSGATSFEFLGGNGRSRAIALCYYGKTRDRLEELRQRYDLDGGGQ